MLQGRRTDVPARCPGGNCITAKIDEYSRRLKEGRYDQWGAAGDLAFLIHFVGDLINRFTLRTTLTGEVICVMVDSSCKKPTRRLGQRHRAPS
jgi:hypothetical protein